ncbi:MAG: flavodoxin [Eubacteriales bacterium]|nr:flavodoxin [Eubacteriales bacterium]
MKIRKSILFFTLASALSFVLAACGSSNSFEETASAAGETETVPETLQTEAPEEEVNEEPAEEPETTEPETAEAEAPAGNVLVAYFSYTGNTEEAARMIAKYTGGTMAEIQRAEEYGDLQEEAEAEILDGVHPQITVSVDSIEGYDTIFVGYPIWWDEAPAMIATFLAENDFSGKTVIPFCTSSSDDIGNSLHIFGELCPDAEIAEGLTANDLNDIEPWIQGLGLME